MSISGMKEELDALERFYEHSPIDKPARPNRTDAKPFKT
jgi:hypothetical protein